MEERWGLLPNSRSLSQESHGVCFSSPLHPSHICSLTHTLSAAAAVLRGCPPFWRLAHTCTPRALYVHSSCAHRHKHRQPPPLMLTLHLQTHGVRRHQHVADTSLTHTSPGTRLISFCLSVWDRACAIAPWGRLWEYVCVCVCMYTCVQLARVWRVGRVQELQPIWFNCRSWLILLALNPFHLYLSHSLPFHPDFLLPLHFYTLHLCSLSFFLSSDEF